MDAPTSTPNTDQAGDDGGSFAYCAWHQDYSRSARLVRLADQGSAHGGPGLFACVSCRHAYDLVPVADRP